MEDNYFIISWWFLPFINMNRPQVFMCPHPPSWTLSHFPPHPNPLGWPRAPALGALLQTLNLHWSSILHMIIGTSRKQPAWQYRRCKRHRVGKNPWKREWQPTPVFLPGESHGQRSLLGYCPRGGRVRHDWSDLAHVRVHTHTHSHTQCISFNASLSNLPTLSFFHWVQKSVLYICVFRRSLDMAN